MRTIGFLGAYDKIDLILYIARILTLAQKKVLIIDASLNQKAKYIVPAISPTKTYVTEFEGFDVAVGFESLDKIKEYLGVEDKTLEYDVALLDMDSFEAFKNFKAVDNFRNLFVTGFDLYSLKRGIEIISNFSNPIKLTKVLFSLDMDKDENEYLDYLSTGCNVNWDKNIYTFPIEPGNYAVSVENQIVSRVKMKGLSGTYKDNLQFLIEGVFGEIVSSRDISRVIKNLEREV